MTAALLLVDLQGDYLTDSRLEPAAGQVVAAAARLLAGWRAHARPIVHVWTTVRPDDDRRMPHWREAGRWQCVEGTPGHQPPASLLPLEGETIVHKTFFSAFSVPELAGILRSRGCDTLLVCGVHLHACVRATVLDAYAYGLQAQVAEDAVGSNDPLHAAITRSYLASRAVRFMTVDEILAQVATGETAARRDAARAPALPALRLGPVDVPAGTLPRRRQDAPGHDGEALFSVPICDAPHVAQATAAARDAWPQWRHTEIQSRAGLLRRLADLLHTQTDRLAGKMAVEVGKPLRHGQGEVRRAVALLRAVAAHADDPLAAPCGPGVMSRRRPHGVVAAITPWNNPVAIPLGKIAPALLFGNTVVWKPAPAGAALAHAIMDVVQAAQCPSGALALVLGDETTAQTLLEDDHVDMVTLSGGPAAGYAAAAICARRHLPLQAELGGNNAAIVWSDAASPRVAATVAEGAFGFAGQRCTANRRVIVDERCYDEFLAHLQAATAALVWDDPRQFATQVGPLISQRARERVAGLVQRAAAAGCVTLTPHPAARASELCARGAYYPPTIICAEDPLLEIVQEETFGPVLVVQRANDWAHALALCNGVRQGLVAALFSHSPQLQESFLIEAQAGILKLNAATVEAGVEAPFGGWKASGMGPPEHGAANREAFTRAQAIYRCEDD